MFEIEELPSGFGYLFLLKSMLLLRQFDICCGGLEHRSVIDFLGRQFFEADLNPLKFGLIRHCLGCEIGASLLVVTAARANAATLNFDGSQPFPHCADFTIDCVSAFYRCRVRHLHFCERRVARV